MPSEKMNISIPIGGGLDTKTDRKQVIPAKVLALKNGEFTSIKEISKRNGFENVWNLNTTSVNGAISEASTLLTRGNEVIQMARQETSSTITPPDGWVAVSVDGQLNNWQKIGRVEPIQQSVETASPSKEEIYQVDMEIENGYACYTWIDVAGYIHYSIIEEETGAKIIEDQILDRVATACPHVVGFDDNFYIWCLAGNALFCAVVDSTDLQNPTTVMANITVNEGLSLSSGDLMDVTKIEWDGVPGDWRSIVAHKIGVGNTIQVLEMSAADPPTLITTTPIAQVPVGALAVQRVDDSVLGVEYIGVSWQQGTSLKWQAIIYQPVTALGIMVANTGIMTLYPLMNPFGGFGETIRNITMVEDRSLGYVTASHIRFYAEYNTVVGYPHLNTVRTAFTRSDGVTIVTPNVTYRNCCLASRAFAYDFKARVWVTYESDLQSTMFLHSCISTSYDTRPYPVDAKLLALNHDGQTNSLGLPQVVEVATGQYATAALRRDRLTTGEDDGIDAQIPIKSVVRVNTTFGLNAMDNDTLGPTRAVATGGYIGDLDGRFQELGFHLYPEPVSLFTPHAHIPPGPGNGDLSGYPIWALVYEWTDGQGQVHRSYPHIIQSDEEVTGVNDSCYIEGIPYLHKGEHDKLENVYVDVYRQCSDGLFHKLPRQAGPQGSLNDLDWPSFVYDDHHNESTDNLLARELLYTTGGVLGNDGPPAAEILDVRQDRIIIVPSDDPDNHWYSKIKKNKVGNEFSALLTKRISTGGPTKAISTLDEKEIIFKEFEIHAFSGPGPNDLGLGSSFTESYLISSDVGCVDRASVVKFDKGLMFKSSKGIYLLDRGLQTSYIGAPVESYNQFDVVKSYLVKGKNQIRFLLSNNETLNFDYLVGQWSVSTFAGLLPSSDMRDCVVHNDAFHMLGVDGNIWRESTASYADNISYYPLDITFSWIKMNGIQGYQRVSWMSILGEFKGNHILTVDLSYDYDDTVVETKILNATAAFGALPPYQFRFKPQRQKCQAIKLRIYDTLEPAWAGSWEGYSLSSIEMEVRVKRGMNKLATAKTI